MKIAILGTKGIPGHHGVEVVVDALCPYLSEMGHDIVVYGYDTYTKNRKDYKNVEIRVVRGSSRKNLEMISHMGRSALLTRRETFDIVHIHSVDPCLLAWVPKSRLGVVATSHGQAYMRGKWGRLARTLSKTAERFFIHIPKIRTSVSKPLAEWYEKKYGKPVCYIPNGVRFREKPDAAILAKWGVPANGFLFCSAGRMEKTKGLHTLLDAYEQVSPAMPLLIAGGGVGSDPDYMAALKTREIPGVRFVGFLTGDELFSLYAHARAFIFPSEYEAMSMALLEGLSFGVPVIYSDIPENRAVAEDVGYAFPVSDKEALAGQIERVISHEEEAKEMGRLASAHIHKHHDWANVAKQYDAIYRML